MNFPYEQYVITLTHEIVDNDGKPHRLDEPIVVRNIVERAMWRDHEGIVINEMMEKLKLYLLEHVQRRNLNEQTD